MFCIKDSIFHSYELTLKVVRIIVRVLNLQL
jgi:hypothetical protein